MDRYMVGVPKEVKQGEGRVAITPDMVRALRRLGIRVGVGDDAGSTAGFSDRDYLDAGACIYLDPDALFRDSDIVLKVKEPVEEEYGRLSLLRGRVLFTFLHLAGSPHTLTGTLLEQRIIGIAYENVTHETEGRVTYPILFPMSRIAGVQSMRGAIMRHEEAVRRDLRVVILGCGTVGEAALLEALMCNVRSVSVFEICEERKNELEWTYRKVHHVNFFPFTSLDTWGRKELTSADIVISAVMLPDGAAAPRVLSQKHFRTMKHGAYVADVAIDQGGSTAWSKPTAPGATFVRGKRKLVFSCVPNIPGSTVPHQATEDLTQATFPYVKLLAERLNEGGIQGLIALFREHAELRSGLQTWNGELLNRHAAEKHGLLERYRTFEDSVA